MRAVLLLAVFLPVTVGLSAFIAVRVMRALNRRQHVQDHIKQLEEENKYYDQLNDRIRESVFRKKK